MTESEPDAGDAGGGERDGRDPDGGQPDGSVGRYVRERWSADLSERRRRRPPSAVPPPPAGPPTARSVPAHELRPTTLPNWGGPDAVAHPRAVPARPPHPPAGPQRGAPDVPAQRSGAWPVRRDDAGGDGAAPPAGPPPQNPAQGPIPQGPAQGPVPQGPVQQTPAPLHPPQNPAQHAAADVPTPRATPRVPGTGPVSAVRPGQQPRPVDGRRPAGPPTPPRGTARWVDPAAMAAQEAQRARSGAVAAGSVLPDDLADLSSARLLRPTRRAPQSGWRRLLYVLSGRLVNPGESPADVRRRELVARINAPLLGCHKIALLSLKGGVGKTTMTATLGATFSSLRGDRVVAVDANPDRGTLSQKIPLETSATVRHLLRDAQRVRRYTDVRAYTSQGSSRLEVLASEQDPAVSEAFSEDDYRRTVTLLEHFYNMVLTDCGTGLMHSAMYGVLGVADQLVVVSSGSIDGARSASATMDWLDAHGHGDLVSGAVTVINCVSRSAGGVDLDRVAEHFGGRCRAVVRIPFDAHLQEGAEVDLDRLEPATRTALLELAAVVADAFPS